ncbi:hypothetical protein [Aliiglaciecola litoralis]|uniref:Solute-binding protein family 3/N-terminal domain-containing protein n=1 Tax=Aliiglaciecola litoralis TaxID=582857 RepID=A0ABP3WZ69_9ALTE
MRTNSATLLLTFTLSSLTAHSNPLRTADIAVYKIEDVLEVNRNDLPYVKILSLLDQRIPIKLEYQFIHALRAAETFNNKNIACLFPGSILAYDSDRELIESKPIQIAKAYFIAKKTYDSQKILANKDPSLRIGFRRGNTYGGQIKTLAHHRLIPLNSGADIRQLIELDRIDVFLGYLPDSFPVIHAIPEKPLQYNEASLFYSQNDSFLCQNTFENQILVNFIDYEIQKMHDSGELAQILAPLNQPEPEQPQQPQSKTDF